MTIAGEAFTVTHTASTLDIFPDGFETGDLWDWSNAIPDGS